MKNLVMTIGVFDGVHRGHQKIFQKVAHCAKEHSGKSLAYTFDPHPARILVPESCPPMIMTQRQKRAAILANGIDRVVVQKFTPAFSRLSAQDFFDRILLRQIRPQEIFVGYNFTFGYHRGGTVETLEAMGKKAGIRVTVVEPFLWKEMLVSSTQIRSLLSKGQISQATELLGKPYRMTGKVVGGRGLGGKILGIPTANLRSENDLILPVGVYATLTILGKKSHPSVTNIGRNPTFGPRTLSIETHILNFQKKILGHQMEIEFVERIRDEIPFSSPRELSQQIQNDIHSTKKILKV
ncbi:MAG: bifunctional riboflavin kinase/FAD synthetase [Deltaproteobacteria bacterium]|nr:bifunctional riboflavin kinase/FAD synthetase [Deltaproteobacteria bacterium]